jgi:hypothetical protein
VKNLNLFLPKDGIKEKMTPHADLIFPRPWNPMEGKDLGSRVWGESGGGRELGLGRSTALVREGSGWEREKSEI